MMMSFAHIFLERKQSDLELNKICNISLIHYVPSGKALAIVSLHLARVLVLEDRSDAFFFIELFAR